MIGELVAKLIASGTPPEVAAQVVAEAFAAGAQLAIPRNSGGIPVDETAEKRRAYDRNRKRNSGGIPVETGGIPPEPPKVPLSNSEDIKKRERQNRGTRITPDWTPLEPERAFAKTEGFSDWEIQREAQKFRDYWTACAGAKGVKLDWSATWRQWIRSGAERAGKSPAPTSGDAAASGFYAEAESEQLAAWDTHLLKTTGRALPRDRKGGWHVKSEWPPGYGEFGLIQVEPERQEAV